MGGLGEMIQWVKCQPHKPEELNLSQVWWYIAISLIMWKQV